MRYLILILALVLQPPQVMAENESTVKNAEPRLVEQLQSNLRWSIDLSSRAVSRDDDSFTQNVAGLDVHKVFSGASRDYATLVFQPYIVNFHRRESTPYFFDGKSTELTWRIANINFMASADGALNLRVGHFEVPFGLEQNMDTNGTLRQFTAGDRGIKADWGISLNGSLDWLEYEFALTRGSGNDIDDRDNPHVYSGRLGSLSHRNLVYGFSVFDAEVLGAQGTTRRRRLGFDVAQYYRTWEFLAEVSAGENEDKETALGLIDISWRNALETLHLYTQLIHQYSEIEQGHDSGSTLKVGFFRQLHYGFSVSAQWTKLVETIGPQSSDDEFSAQLRFRL